VRACASEAGFVPGQYVNLGELRIDHLMMVIDSETQGASLVVPNGSSNAELRFNDGSPTIVLGTVTPKGGANSGLYALDVSPSVNVSMATVGHGTSKQCDLGGVFGATIQTFETETNQMSIQAGARTVVLKAEITVRQTGEHPAIFGCH
jgi:hypothetical protein